MLLIVSMHDRKKGKLGVLSTLKRLNIHANIDGTQEW
jgi:hypothetical protein